MSLSTRDREQERALRDRDRDVIRDYQWIELRNKIGLSTSEIQKLKHHQKRQLDKDATKYIHEHIKRKKSYKEGEGTIKVEEMQTNAFGKLKFVNCPVDKPAQYLRLADNTDMKHIKKIIEDTWGMVKHNRKPHLAISVVGGTKHLSLNGKKREALKKTILAAAQPTNAWFLTEGINLGCSKLIGEIVKEGQFYIRAKEDKSLTKMTRGLKAIGICSWRLIANKESLLNKVKSRGTVSYDSKYSDYDDTAKTYKFTPGKNDNKLE